MIQLPEALLQQLNTITGFNKASFVEAHQFPAVTSIRLHTIKKSDIFSIYAPVPWCEDGIYMDSRPVFTLDPAYHAGAYYVQEASSMFAGYVFSQVKGDRNNLRVLDLCAAPGGKSTLIASLLDADSLLITNDVIRSRATILEENMTRWGYMNTWVTSNDPVSFEVLTGYFDVILIDAPCSGSGLFRKDKRALDDWSEDNVQLCSERQKRIIANIMPALKQGGVLLYATCSYSPEENEEIVDWMADNYDVSDIKIDIEESWGIMKTETNKHHLSGYRFFPYKVDGEGFFMAALQKNGESVTMRPQRNLSEPDNKSVYARASYLLENPHDAMLIKHDTTGVYHAIRLAHYNDWQLLQKKLYFRKTGTALGEPASKDWIPHHETALSIGVNDSITRMELDREDALKFLKKRDLGFTIPVKGWYIAAYDGLGLGWIKALDNRINNYLPKSWRIRMEIEE